MKTQDVDKRLDPSLLEHAARILKTIAHPVRLEIIEVLEKEERLAVTSIQERLEVTIEQSMLSHHLIKMRDNGILACKKEGKQVLYTILDRNVLKILECMSNCNIK